MATEYAQIDLYKFLTESDLQQYYNAIKNELKITNPAHLKYATDEDLANIGLSRPEIRRLRKFHEKYFPHGYLRKIKRLLQAPTTIVKREDGISTQSLSTISLASGESAANGNAANAAGSAPSKTPNNKHIIPADSISVNKQLGTGEFGIVQQGVWTNGTDRIQVAIKCLCRERMQSNPMEFLKEAAIMHSVEHENIVRLYGVVLATDSLMLVTELAHLRSLLECLKDPGLRTSFLTVPTLCEFAHQICNGMRYLESKRLIHRDLAARNILVFSKSKVKISDFGLSRALGVGKDYYKTNFNVNLKLPIAWCAPECINYLRFTNASDVWAYGVCLWEMFSYGFQPWAALTGLQILEAIDAPNFQRLEQPECCPSDYYTLMMKCWQDDPVKRPKFSEICELLPEMKPEQLKAVANCLESKKDHLLYRQGDILTVLDRNTGTSFWKGVLMSGKTGLFNPSNTVAYVEGLPISNRETFCRLSERNSTRRKLCTEMISKPQNDLKHTGHIGIDGASFGDIAFLGNSKTYNHVPRQIVTPYKPSEDIEQIPLLLPPTPTSPDSLQTASGYFPDGEARGITLNQTFIPSTENTPKHLNQSRRAAFQFPGLHASTNPFAKQPQQQQRVEMSVGKQNNNRGIDSEKVSKQTPWSKSTECTDDAHEYHEISDDEITAHKLDFGPSLLDEINSVFGSMSTGSVIQPKTPDFEQANKENDFTEITSKKEHKNSAKTAGNNLSCDSNANSKFSVSLTRKKTAPGNVKPISVKDEKILNQAIDFANEISARSMIDLVSDQLPKTQSPKRKFSFRFPHLNGNGNGSGSSHDKNGRSTGNEETISRFGITSPHLKKKNFIEELKSIPDLQRFRSLSEIKDSSSMIGGAQSIDIRIPLFDKECSDFCFEKSREILSRPLVIDNLPPPLYENQSQPQFTNGTPHRRCREQKSFSENIMDIENTLKALNLDFMHTYDKRDKADSDETILLNEQFSSIVSSIEDEITSAEDNYNNTRAVMETMFDFNAATSHLDKHLQYMTRNQQQSIVSDISQDQKLHEDKRSSTPDTGFASRDTNMSLSRRSSQKSNYSPLENLYNPKELKFQSSSFAMIDPFGGSVTKYRMNSVTSPSRSKNASHATAPSATMVNTASKSNVIPNSPNQIILLEKADSKAKSRQRSMSFNDNFNPDSPVLSEPQQTLKGFSPNEMAIKRTSTLSADPRKRRSTFYKSRSRRARTLRRLSCNPIVLDSSSSNSADSDCNGSIAQSECDIRARDSNSLQRRRRQTFKRTAMSAISGYYNEQTVVVSSHGQIYGSNASIKSAPHFNYGGSRSASAVYRNARSPCKQSYFYEERIYDFDGGRGPGGDNMSASQNLIRPAQSFTANGSSSGGTSPTSNAGQTMGVGNENTTAQRSSSIFNDFKIHRFVKSPTSGYLNSSAPDERIVAPLPLLNDRTANATAQSSFPKGTAQQFHWPEKIHGSTVKQHDLTWRYQQSHQQTLQQQQQDPSFVGSSTRTSTVTGIQNCTSEFSSSSDSENNDFVFRTEFIKHLPPSPAP